MDFNVLVSSIQLPLRKVKNQIEEFYFPCVKHLKKLERLRQLKNNYKFYRLLTATCSKPTIFLALQIPSQIM